MSPAPPHGRRAFLRRSAALAGSAAVAGCLGGGPSPAERVEEHRDDLEALGDVAAAIQAGYQTTGRYVRTADGVLGEAFVDRRVDSLEETRPNAVLFDLTETGQYRPLGLKWVAPVEEYDGPPTLFGREFRGPIESDVPSLPRHYALHLWLFRENPAGRFARYNPAVEPVGLVDEIAPVREALRPLVIGGEAESAGFRNSEACVAGYGVQFVRDGTTGGTDPTDPPVLRYRITENWTYLLLGPEWWVPAADRDAAPTLFGQRFHAPRDGHSPATDQPSHYGLHAWLFYANPRGMFAPSNPLIEC